MITFPNKSDPNTDYVTTSFSKYGKIIEVIELPDCRTYEEIIKYLSEKSIPYTPGRKYFFALSGSKGNIPGLLCSDKDFDVTNETATIVKVYCFVLETICCFLVLICCLLCLICCFVHACCFLRSLTVSSTC